ncbi:MAG TPA: adenylate kinase family protein [Candidatus Thermoplasmatota archaeon]|nr:adenylate kinase family protein [Candidatus Thermoplasmatota archaeon]
MIIALTGTPGTGKTTIASILKKYEVIVISLKALAEQHNFIESYDEQRQSNILNLDAIEQYLKKTIKKDELVIVESHLAHLLSIVDSVIVLRCHPQTLRKRLEQRNWPWKKIYENLESEILDVILCESVEDHGKQSVKEIDTSTVSAKNIAENIFQIINGSKTFSILLEPGNFDWSEYLFDANIMEQ